MPRPRTVPDTEVLDAALDLARTLGPDGVTFGALSQRVGLAGSTIVQRYGNRARLVRAALLRAWDLLDEATERAIAHTGDGPAGVVELLVELSGQYDARDFADQLLVLREDVRDPILRARGSAWIGVLDAAVEARLHDIPGGAEGLGPLVVAQWQGTLTVWSFTPVGTVAASVRAALTDLLGRLDRTGTGRPTRSTSRRPPAPAD